MDPHSHNAQLANLDRINARLDQMQARLDPAHLETTIAQVRRMTERERHPTWRSSLRNARAEIAVLLDDSPSLRREVSGLLARWYPLARQDAADETGLPLATFPELCPWSVAQILDADVWPEEGREA